MDGNKGPARFGQLLRANRIRAGFTQQQLADFATLSVRAVRDLERGHARHPRRDTVRLLADALHLKNDQRAGFENASRAGDQPAIVDEAATTKHPDLHTPPSPLTATIGREAELRVLSGLLTQEHQRLVTVVGLSGVGKTQLAMEVAHNLHVERGWSVSWLSADRKSPGLSNEMLSRISECPQRPGDGQLADVTHDRDTLLVLDGESGWPERSEWIVTLLQRNPSLRVLLTTLAPCGIRGEAVMPLSPLAVPTSGNHHDVSALLATPSVQLLLQRVRRLRPDLKMRSTDVLTTAALCRLLDGLPRALEHVAEWFLIYSPDQILHLVRRDPFALGTPPDVSRSEPDVRESLLRTMRILDPQVRLVLAHLAAAADGWSLEDAERLVPLNLAGQVRAVHVLRMHGLLTVTDGTDARFFVPNLVRFLHAESPAAGGKADGVVSGTNGATGGRGLTEAALGRQRPGAGDVLETVGGGVRTHGNELPTPLTCHASTPEWSNQRNR